VNVTILGSNFRPGATVALVSGTGATFPITDVTVDNGGTIFATVPTGIPAGSYGVVVTNTDSTSGTLDGGYLVTGSASAPISILPAVGTNDVPNNVTIDGFSFQDGVTVSLIQGALEVPLLDVQRISSTQIQAVVPNQQQVGSYDVDVHNPGIATDGKLLNAYTILAGNAGTSDNGIVYVGNSDVWSDPVTVRQGQTVSLGLNLHRIGGNTSIQVPVSFYLGDPKAGGTLIGSVTSVPIPPVTPLESVSVPWNVGAAVGQQTIFAVVDPSSTLGAATQFSNEATWTFTVLGAAPDTVPPAVHAVTVNGGSAQTSNPTVSVDLTADDNAGGDSLTKLFLVDRVFSQAALSWIPVQQTGWIPYAATTTLTLSGQAGVHFVQAFVADAAGNVSTEAVQSAIDYVPATDSLLLHQVRVYRQPLNVGDTLSVDVHPVSGDPDLYVYDPNNNEVLVSNNSVGDDSGKVSASVAGVYQIEVYAYVDTTYQISIAVNGVTQQAVGAPAVRSPQSNPAKPNRSSPIIPVSSEPEGKSAIAAPGSNGAASSPTRTPTVVRPFVSQVFVPFIANQAGLIGW
jgi:hypothetical protein